MSEIDVQLPLKKRARRRLVGAVAFAALVAVLLPVLMDQTPQAPVADVQIRIPARDQVEPLSPAALLAAPVASSVDTAGLGEQPASPMPSSAKVPDETLPARQRLAPSVEQSPAKINEKTAIKNSTKSAGATVATQSDYIILIGAFANAANVKQLQTKLAEIGVKTYTEPLESSQGKKTRVRAGPFANREAAEKALEKMKHIGVNGVLVTKS